MMKARWSGCMAYLCLTSFGWAVPALDFFEKKVRPVLVEHCYECHSVGKKVKGGLALDSQAAVLKGGDSGALAGHLDEAIGYKNQDLQMPPAGALPAEMQQVLLQWQKLGFPMPSGAAAGPVATAKPMGMGVEEGRKFWAFRPLVNAAVPRAGRDGWALSAVDEFLLAGMVGRGLEPAPQAERAVLLRRVSFDLTGLPPSPAELASFLQDDRPGAWERVVERLLASPAYGERWGRHWLDVARYADSNGMDENVALGHAWRYRDWVVRAFNQDMPYDEFVLQQVAGDLMPGKTVESITATGFLSLGAKVLAEPDVEKLLMDVIDEQIDTLGKAFLGMTLGCARCHAHKFDPIQQEDYYALAAIFRSTQSLGTDRFGALKFWNEHSLATQAELDEKTVAEKKMAARRAEITKAKNQLRAGLRQELELRVTDYLCAALELTGGEAQLAAVAKAHGLRAHYLAAMRQYAENHAEMPLLQVWHRALAGQGRAELRGYYQGRFADKGDAEAAAALKDTAGLIAIPERDKLAFEGEALRQAEAWDAELQRMEDHLPEPAAVMAVAEGQVAASIPLHIRGSHLNLGAAVKRGFPEVMQTSYLPKVMPKHQSGRLELARWLASSEHPLTARVMVNRIWRWHFGSGLVASTDNFGVLGDRPSHPELLDWLAQRFIESGWSVKEMHRLILRSRVYQMQSLHPASVQSSAALDPREVDPENKMLSHFPMLRLEAEQLRDAVLAVSSGLLHDKGGKTVPQRNKQFIFNHTSTDRVRYESARRSLYLPVIRNHLSELLEQFDYPDPSAPTGSRNSTTVAPQALILLNAPYVMEAAQRLAAELQGSSNKQAEQVGLAYERLYNRPVTQQELARGLHFLQGQNLALLCHTLMAANEFMYLR